MTWGRIGPYGLIAGLCVLVNLAILVAGDRAGLHYVVSISISFVVCVVLGYLLHSRFTFLVPINLGGFSRYTVAMVLNYPLAIVAVGLFHQVLSLPMIFAAPAATIVQALYNLFSSHWAIAPKTVRQ